MRKKLLILGLIMVMTLTACGSKDKEKTKEPTNVEEESKGFTDEEVEKLEENHKMKKNPPYEMKIDKNNRTVNVFITENPISNTRFNRVMRISKYLNEKVVEDVIVKVYFDDDKDNILLKFKDGEILEDNLEEYRKEHSKKFTEDSTEESSTKIDSYKTKDYSYEFLGFEVLPPNPSYGYDKYVLAVNMKFTNNSSESTDAWMAFTTDVAAQQSGEELEGGMTPENYKPVERENYDKKIRPGESIEVVFVYELLDKSNVKLVDRWTEGSKYKKEVPVK